VRQPSRLQGGRYEILAPIASGAMGEVLRGRRDDGAQVAIKRLLDPRHAVRFEIEARLLARLDHPRVVRVLDHFADAGESFLVMELVPGVDLRRHVDRHGRPGLPADEAVTQVVEACEALAYVHEQHVVHRDVKPQNLILSPDGVVLVDFGVARDAPTDRPGTVGLGTPAYMAPEVRAGGEASPRSDVYGLAATLWTLLSGSPPRGAPGADGLPAPAAGSARLAAALRGGLALDPAARLASASALAAALGHTLTGATGGSLARTTEAGALPAPLIAAIARAVAGVLGATAVSLSFSTGEELVYAAAWGAGADEVVGLRLPLGAGIAGAALTSGEVVVVPDCRADPRFAREVAERTGYVPHTMIAAPLRVPDGPAGVLSALDRADGTPYAPADAERAVHAARLAELALAGRAGEAPTAPGARE
jgi:hypothetical protein